MKKLLFIIPLLIWVSCEDESKDESSSIIGLWAERSWFDDDGVIYKAWEVKEKVSINEYNNYYNFLHNYELINRFVGRDKIIWGTWDEDLPKEYFDVRFDLVDTTEDGLHPGSKAHKQYAKKIKDVLQDRFK